MSSQWSSISRVARKTNNLCEKFRIACEYCSQIENQGAGERMKELTRVVVASEVHLKTLKVNKKALQARCPRKVGTIEGKNEIKNSRKELKRGFFCTPRIKKAP
jgi:hypothetical protein